MKLSTEEIIDYFNLNYNLNKGSTFHDIFFNMWGFLVKVETSSLDSRNSLAVQLLNFIEANPDREPDIIIRIIRVDSFFVFPDETDYADYARDDNLLLVSPFFVCRFNESFDCFELIVKNGNEMFLLSAMRTLAPHLASKLNGTLIHASGISYNNKLYAFIGESGVGKSTVVKMLADYQVLSDEAIMILNNHTQPNDLLGWGTPYGRENGGNNIAVPFGYCFFLVQDTTTYLKKLDPAQAITRLLANLWCNNTMGDLALSAFDLVMQVSHKVPCYELHFELNNSFWQEITRAVNVESIF